ncbi:hypothetical protein PC9H_008768 [Pleurotus ostreatus]|uniref:Uncharacterized protein n=1 Tax=Pleurotus ostreatus TaxID=5322 RepID=A0A8H6ZWF3_PLEOS|nr:uncharacterized protein PC9H_008768 [Pleurotus ostreatus]KAF7426400.1 hypothetical protein PC9H_008768 [Pleurotus ostreatus]
MERSRMTAACQKLKQSLEYPYNHILVSSNMDAFTTTKVESIAVAVPPINEEGSGNGGGAYCVVA